MWYHEEHDESYTPGDGVVIPLKPHTELPVVLSSLDMSGFSTGWVVFDNLLRVFQSASDGLEIHENITKADLDAFEPLMHWVEPPTYFRMSPQTLWRVHGAVNDYFFRHRPDCDVTEGVLTLLSAAVGSLSGPAE